VSLHAVQKAIRSRRIELVDGRIDVDRADLDWARNTRLRRAPLTYSVPQDVDHTAVLRDGHLARLAKIECEERIRRLVNRSEVEAAMLMVARRIAPVLARESDPGNIEGILAKEMRAALAGMVLRLHG
jgi:hypothetical protein